ncbi:MAG TPA: carboxypeptidase regulatory-like domain-containing protein, partial [Vicinamibacterales bacterium]|nr:carboxypeptidase regulatory-like domain-containing protein [Vicinamibacterales bacterium]
MGTVDAWQQAAAGSCRISGRVLSGSTPLPGVSIVAGAGDMVKAATSTDPDGTYRLPLNAGSYTLTAELTG